MKIRNFTGKTLRIKNAETGKELVFEAEGKVHINYTYTPEMTIDEVPILGERTGIVVDLPEKEEGTFIVIPWTLKPTPELWERDDLLTAPIANSEETSKEIICTFLEK